MEIKIPGEKTDGRELVIRESVWTGKKEIALGGVDFKKVKGPLYRSETGEEITVKGNSFSYLGMKAIGKGFETEIYPPKKWYEWLLTLLPVVLAISLGIVGGVVAGVIGGALQGAVFGLFGGVCAFCANLVCRKVETVWLKILLLCEIVIISALAGFFIGYGLGLARVAIG